MLGLSMVYVLVRAAEERQGSSVGVDMRCSLQVLSYFHCRQGTEVLFPDSVLKLQVEERGPKEATITIFKARSSCWGVGGRHSSCL